jgi:hypothetical protein
VPSFGELTDQVISTLQGFTTDQPALGTLTGAITSSSTTLTLNFGGNPGASRPNGLVEIDRELIVINTFDATTGTATTGSWGRGQRGTTPAAHAAGAMVTVRPRYPRKQVGDTINQVIRACCPPLFAPRDLAPISTGAFVGLGYELPEDTVRVLRVDATDPYLQPLADRRVLRNWTVRSVAGTQLLEVPDCEVFETLQVTIAASPGKLTADADDFATVTGLAESCADAVVFGAIARLILGVDLARQQVTSVEAANRGDRIGVSSGMQVSRYYQALYTDRLTAEQNRLLQQYPLTLLRRG